MNKKDILDKIKSLDSLSNEERAYLVNLVITKKKYGLVWEDKPEKVKELLRTKLPILKEVSERAIINDTETEKYPNHMLIEGDNLHALSSLVFSHEEQIDVIYIDPPYNTGARDWKYNNDYVDKNDEWRHSTWISFMHHRLLIARKLLAEDGALICAIDHNEQENLGLILRDVFPDKESTCITVVHNPRGIQGDNFSYTHEYAYFVYPKGKFIGRIKRNFEDNEWSNLRNWGGESERKDGRSLFYPLYFKDGKLIAAGESPEDSFHPIKAFDLNADGIVEIWPIDNNGVERKWRYSKSSLMKITEKIRIIEINGILQAQILKDEDRPKTVWTDKRYDANIYGTQLLGSIIDTRFPFPKSLNTVYDCIKAVSANKKNAIILDYFAGSGTTGHAILKMNNEDGGKRRFILCTNNESNICVDVTYQRIKNCMSGFNFKGNEKEVLYEKKINMTAFKKSKEILDDINKIIDKYTSEYDSFKCAFIDGNIKLSGIKSIQGFKQGYKNNNLRYYKCDFTDGEPTLLGRRKLTHLATDLICIKEDCYLKVNHSFSFTDKEVNIFTDGNGKFTVVVHHSRNQLEIQNDLILWIDQLKGLREKVRLYAFSPEKEQLIEEFYQVRNKIEAIPIPSAIHNVYINTVRNM